MRKDKVISENLRGRGGYAIYDPITVPFGDGETVKECHHRAKNDDSYVKNWKPDESQCFFDS